MQPFVTKVALPLKIVVDFSGFDMNQEDLNPVLLLKLFLYVILSNNRMHATYCVIFFPA